jgi:hypothetical protein
MGFQALDPEMSSAYDGGRFTTLAGMVMDGSLDTLEEPPAPDPTVMPAGIPARNQIPTALVDYLEFYLLNYFKPALYEQTDQTARGRAVFTEIGCSSCHVPDLQIDHDRRVADLETVYDPQRGIFNGLFATANPLFKEVDDGKGLPTQKIAKLEPFLVKNIFTDLKRHDLGPNFHERNYDGTMLTQIMTLPLWGVGTSAPYGHDGRSVNLNEVILRHGGEAQTARNSFANAAPEQRADVIAFLNSLVLFPPDDTASTLDPGAPTSSGFPQVGHGSIKLTVLFNNPADIE